MAEAVEPNDSEAILRQDRSKLPTAKKLRELEVSGKPTPKATPKEPSRDSVEKSRRAAAGRAELLAKWQYTDRLQNLAKLRRFRIGGG